MNSSSSDMHASMIGIHDDDEKSKNSSSNSDQYEDLNATNHQSRAHISRSSVTSSSSTSLSNGGTKRQKDISPCYVCGAKAHGYNFDQSNDLIAEHISPVD